MTPGDEPLMELWQAEWCPHSSVVRELLTELDVDYVARQVEAYPEQREQLRERTGHDTIPVAVFADGEIVGGPREAVVEAIRARYPEPATAEDHRQQVAAHE